MARYTWAFDDRVFTSLREVKEAARELFEIAQAKQGVELVYDASRTGARRAVYEIKVNVTLRPH